MNELILLTDFWKNQSIENYLNCKDYFYRSKSFDPFEKYIEKVILDIDNQDYAFVLDAFKETRQLSLFLLDKISFSYKMLDNAAEAVKYFTKANEVVQVILQTGDGTREKPYQIIYGSDSKELLLYLNESYSRHSIVDFEGLKLETVITTTGKEYFFDVTDLLLCKENAVQDKVDDMIKWFDKNTNRPV